MPALTSPGLSEAEFTELVTMPTIVTAATTPPTMMLTIEPIAFAVNTTVPSLSSRATWYRSSRRMRVPCSTVASRADEPDDDADETPDQGRDVRRPGLGHRDPVPDRDLARARVPGQPQHHQVGVVVDHGGLEPGGGWAGGVALDRDGLHAEVE